MQRAISAERFGDAASLRDDAGAGLVSLTVSFAALLLDSYCSCLLSFIIFVLFSSMLLRLLLHFAYFSSISYLPNVDIRLDGGLESQMTTMTLLA